MINKKHSLSESIASNQVWFYFILTVIIGLILSGTIYLVRLDIYNSAIGILLYLIYMLCPAIIAVVLLLIYDGKDGVVGLFDGLMRWKVGAQWYALAIILPVMIELLTLGAYLAISGRLPQGYSFSLLPWNIALDILISSVGLVLGLGYALPLLMRLYSPMVTSVFAALFVILYRAAALVNDPNFIVMCVGLIALTFLLVWMYNNARNSLLPMMIFMFLYTLISNLLTYRLTAYAGNALPIYLNKALLIVGILAVVLLYRYFSLDEP